MSTTPALDALEQAQTDAREKEAEWLELLAERDRLALKAQQEGATYAVLARIMGVTRDRVNQILNRERRRVTDEAAS